MKEILVLFAEYNRGANRQLYSIAEKHLEVVDKPARSYFDSALGLLNHILVSDLGWLIAYRDSNLDLPTLKSEVLEFEHPGWRKNLFDDFGKLNEHRTAIDDLFVDFVRETSEALFEGNIEVTRKGKSKPRIFPFGKLLIHLFNHQTHHRGAISQVLDEAEVENDYSNILRLLIT